MHGTPYMMRRRTADESEQGARARRRRGVRSSRSTSRPVRARGKFRSAIPPRSRPALAGVSKTPLGTPNLGGPISTAGGIVFIGAAMDHVLRAFDIETGKELWKGKLPGGARATPMTYQVTSRGKQYVVVSVGGGDEWGRGDYVIAFALK